MLSQSIGKRTCVGGSHCSINDLVMRVIERLCEATGTIVVPAWKSAPYWPVLCPDGTHFADFIHHWEKVHFYPQLLHDGHSGNNTGNAMNTEMLILALFTDFTRPPRNFKSDFCIHSECLQCSLVWPARVLSIYI